MEHAFVCSEHQLAQLKVISSFNSDGQVNDLLYAMLQIKGHENLPADNEPAVYVANHQSYMVRINKNLQISCDLGEWN